MNDASPQLQKRLRDAGFAPVLDAALGVHEGGRRRQMPHAEAVRALASRLARRSRRPRGIVIVNVAPAPSCERASMRQPCRSHMDLHRARPTPVPGYCVKLWSRRSGSNMASAYLGSKPMPSSTIESAAPAPCARPRKRMSRRAVRLAIFDRIGQEIGEAALELRPVRMHDHARRNRRRRPARRSAECSSEKSETTASISSRTSSGSQSRRRRHLPRIGEQPVHQLARPQRRAAHHLARMGGLARSRAWRARLSMISAKAAILRSGSCRSCEAI